MTKQLFRCAEITATSTSCVLRRFAADRNGTVAAIFGLSIVPAVLLMGAAWDYGNVIRGRAVLQRAVDAAALDASGAPDNAEAVGLATLNANLRDKKVRLTSTPSIVKNADGSISVFANAAVDTAFMGIVKKSAVEFSSRAGALTPPTFPPTPSEITFNATGASGAYWKQIDLVVRPDGAANDVVMASYVYQPTSYNNYTGTVAAAFLNGNQMIPDDVDTKVVVGENYSNIYLTMKVIDDGCAPNYARAPDSTNANYKCAPVGSYTYSTRDCTRYYSNGSCRTWGAYYDKTVNLTKSGKTAYYTTNPNDNASADKAANLFISSAANSVGNHLEIGKKPSVFDLLPCELDADKTIYHHWEDTPYAGTSSENRQGTWAQQDFHFQVTTAKCKGNSNYTMSSTQSWNANPNGDPNAKAAKGRLTK